MTTKTAVFALMLALGTESACAQGRESVAPRQAVEDLVSGETNRTLPASVAIVSAFGSSTGAYSDSDRRLLLDELESAAIHRTSDTSVETRRGRIDLFAALSTIVMDSFPSEAERSIAARLLRIYDQSGDMVTRTLALSTMAQLLDWFPQEQSAMLAVLENAAASPFAPGDVPPQAAVSALMRAGEKGVEVLRRMNAEGSARDPRVAVHLREMFRNE